MKIAIASDHAGFTIKEKVLSYLIGAGYMIKDFGCFSEESVDYPDYAHPLAEAVQGGEYEVGITVCGTGNGINMTVNKHQGIRSAICWNAEIAALARKHNNANVCALPGRYVEMEQAILIVRTFLNTPFEGGRHEKRIKKIPLKIL
jgi:ribose 5-phosphate isomerase B